MPIDVAFGPEGTVEEFVRNNASWHRSCHQKFNNDILKRKLKEIRKNEEDSSSDLRRSKRRRSEFEYKSMCLFCETSGDKKLHAFQTLEADQSLMRMANEN